MATILSSLLEKLHLVREEDVGPKDSTGQAVDVGDRVVPNDTDAANEEEVASEVTSVEGDTLCLSNGDEVKAGDVRKVGDSVSSVTGVTVGEGRTRRVREGEEVAKDKNGDDLMVGDKFKDEDGEEHEVSSLRAVTDEDDEEDGHIVTNKDGDEFHSAKVECMDKMESRQVRHAKLREARVLKLRESDEVASDADGDEVTVGDVVKEVGANEAEGEEKEVVAVSPDGDGGHNVTLSDGTEVHSSEVDKIKEAEEDGEEEGEDDKNANKMGEAADSATVTDVTVSPLAAILTLDNGTQISVLGAPAGLAVLRMLKGATVGITTGGASV